MKALVYEAERDVRVEEVPDARIEEPTDAVIRMQGRVALDYGTSVTKGQRMGTGQCPVMRYNRQLRDLIVAGRATPSFIGSRELPLEQAPQEYARFDAREDGWTEVLRRPGTTA
jgi:glutathione-independent formaldehyde dehydrogenase